MATILIVDDRSANRKLLLRMLSDQGHLLLEAADGREGLTAARTEHPDLVITDVLMPVMDGYEFVRQLRLDPVTSRIPVVFYTAHYGAREARALALSSGVSAVLTKPAESREVVKIVARALAGESPMAMPSGVSPAPTTFDREHLRLLTDKLSEKAGDLRTSNARLRALINIGLELASEPDSDRRLQGVCVAAHDLFEATYVTLGVLDRHDRTVRHVVTSGGDSVDWIQRGEAAPGILGTVSAERRTLRGENPGGDPVRLRLPSRHPHMEAFLAAPIASTTHVYGWLCLVNNDGRTFTEDDEQLLIALSGQVGRIQELAHEILERTEAESALRYERDRAQRYLDAVDVILLALDLQGRITLINRKGCALLQWAEGELLGRNWMDTCLPARIRETLRRKFENVVAGDFAIVKNPILLRSGEERLIEWHNSTLRDDAGQVIGTLSSGTDITEQDQAVAALRTAEERMRFTLQHANVGIWDMDYTTGTLRWSEIIEAQYGLPSGTFGGSFAAFIERIHPDDREFVIETIGNAVTHGADFSLQHRTLWRDGTVRWLSGAGRILLDEDGEPLRGVGISQDVTERKRAEAEHQRLNDEIEHQRLRVFKATIRTVQDIVNNFLNSFQLVRLEAEAQLPVETLTLVDRTIREAAIRLKTLGDLETVTEKNLASGLGIDYPGAEP